MLFDLRGRGRRRTVQAVYLGLAILIGGGLILFGVGTGTGGGGLLNGIANNGSGGNSSAAVSQQEKTALKAVKANPNSAAAWSALVQARWTSAGAVGNFNASTNTFTASGQKKLAQTAEAWQRYVQLTKTPDPGVASTAARAYAALGQYGDAANSWDYVTISSPTAVGPWECLAATAYAAGQTRKGELAQAKAVGLLPKASQASAKSALTAAKSSTTAARQLVSANCALTAAAAG
jgi:hypothetical protein